MKAIREALEAASTALSDVEWHSEPDFDGVKIANEKARHALAQLRDVERELTRLTRLTEQNRKLREACEAAEKLIVSLVHDFAAGMVKSELDDCLATSTQLRTALEETKP